MTLVFGISILIDQFEYSFELHSYADFSRRRWRKMSTARPRGSSPKGFIPRAPV